MIRNKGFTLIELLVVIAIIGILSSVVLSSLTTARTKASKSAALSTVLGVQPLLVVCISDGNKVNKPTDSKRGGASGTTDYAGTICSKVTSSSGGSPGTDVYPVLPSGWTYYGSTITDASGGYTTAATIKAIYNDDASTYVWCSETSCGQS